MTVTIETDDGARHTYVPSSEDELAKLAPGSSLRVRIAGGSLTIL